MITSRPMTLTCLLISKSKFWLYGHRAEMVSPCRASRPHRSPGLLPPIPAPWLLNSCPTGPGPYMPRDIFAPPLSAAYKLQLFLSAQWFPNILCPALAQAVPSSSRNSTMQLPSKNTDQNMYSSSLQTKNKEGRLFVLVCFDLEN